MACADQFERLVRERQGPIGSFDDLNAPRAEQTSRPLGVGRPPFGDRHASWKNGRLGDDLTPARIDVEGGLHDAESLRQEPRIPPRRSLLDRAAIKPAETPAAHVCGFGLGNQGFVGPHLGNAASRRLLTQSDIGPTPTGSLALDDQ
jgi:hypothetical protein